MKHRFTVTELIVIVALIAILGSILYPVVKKARLKLKKHEPLIEQTNQTNEDEPLTEQTNQTNEDEPLWEVTFYDTKFYYVHQETVKMCEIEEYTDRIVIDSDSGKLVWRGSYKIKRCNK